MYKCVWNGQQMLSNRQHLDETSVVFSLTLPQTGWNGLFLYKHNLAQNRFDDPILRSLLKLGLNSNLFSKFLIFVLFSCFFSKILYCS